MSLSDWIKAKKEKRAARKQAKLAAELGKKAVVDEKLGQPAKPAAEPVAEKLEQLDGAFSKKAAVEERFEQLDREIAAEELRASDPVRAEAEELKSRLTEEYKEFLQKQQEEAEAAAAQITREEN